MSIVQAEQAKQARVAFRPIEGPDAPAIIGDEDEFANGSRETFGKNDHAVIIGQTARGGWPFSDGTPR